MGAGNISFRSRVELGLAGWSEKTYAAKTYCESGDALELAAPIVLCVRARERVCVCVRVREKEAGREGGRMGMRR